jgi:hypothetical protein
MELCRGGRGVKDHEEICYEGRECPLCEKWLELAEEIASLKDDLSSAEKVIAKLENQ